MTDEDYCINGCGRPARHDRVYGITDDGHEITERICCRCAEDDA